MTESEFIEIFADNLNSILAESGIGQNQLAREIGVDKGTISNYINKRRMPSLKIFLNICVALGCSPDELIPLYEFIY